MSEDIITKILDRNNLNEAFKRVKANKGASGIDDMVLINKLFEEDICTLRAETFAN